MDPGATRLAAILAPPDAGRDMASVPLLSARGLAKTFGGALGMKDTDDAPQSLGDLAAGFAVQHTNMLFGEDDTNWFAKGDEPTGTRRGEIGAGLNMMFMPIGMGVKAADGVMGAVDEIQGEKHEEWNPLGDLVGGIFETPKDAPTVGNTGSKPNSWQRDGRRHHDDLFREPLPSHGGSPGRLPSHDGSASLFQGMYD